MCGIVGAVTERDVTPILLEGLRRLEYRGYDSAGMAVLDGDCRMDRIRVSGKVAELTEMLGRCPLRGVTGIAHTRWATHGRPSLENAHPHVCAGEIALVHNGIIENHEALRAAQSAGGYTFESETDSEVVVNEIHRQMQSGQDLFDAVRTTVKALHGAYAIGVISRREPGRLIAARLGNPLVIGIGIGETFIASDIAALLPVTREFMILEDGDIADIRRDGIRIVDGHGRDVVRSPRLVEFSADMADKGEYRHFMLKEIHAQPDAIAETLEGRIHNHRVIPESFGMAAPAVLRRVGAVHIAACGSSYHAGLIARHWIESIAGIPCQVEIASEYRYRTVLVPPDALFVSISQSGETADTLAALHRAQTAGYLATLAICNVAESSLTRESELVFLTRAGPEIGVASTKALTTQLAGLFMLAIALGQGRALEPDREAELVTHLESVPGRIRDVLELEGRLALLAEALVDRHHALYLGRGSMLPVAMEGALKLKEISYIHAEAYAAGELKHGPLALVDADMPVIAVAPNNDLLQKLKSNLQEVRARGGQFFVFTEAGADIAETPGTHVVELTAADDLTAPIVYTVPLQLFAYHVAVLRGADVDQPRNLAKSVTVE